CGRMYGCPSVTLPLPIGGPELAGNGGGLIGTRSKVVFHEKASGWRRRPTCRARNTRNVPWKELFCRESEVRLPVESGGPILTAWLVRVDSAGGSVTYDAHAISARITVLTWQVNN